MTLSTPTGLEGVRAGAIPAPRPGPVTVLLACDHIGFNDALHGSGRMMVDMATGFDPRRVRLVPVVLQGSGRLGQQLQRAGTPLRFLECHRLDPRQGFRLAEVIREVRPDVLHLWDFGAATWGRIAARFQGLPTIVHVRSHHSRYQRRGFPWYAALAYRTLARVTTMAVANSESTRRFAVARMGFAPEQVRVVHNPVTPAATRAPDPDDLARLRLQYGLGRDTPVIGALTRFYPAKGIIYLVRAFARLAPRHPALRLLLAGDGPLRPALEAEAKALGVGDRVIFPGPVRAIAEHLALCTVAAMPSLEEAFGNSASEAIAAGVPVVASREGGLKEIVREGVTGLLVPPGTVEPLAAALERVLLDEPLRGKMRQACLAERDRFSFRHYAAALDACYHAVVAGGAA